MVSTLFISIVPIFFIFGLNLIFLRSPLLKEKVIFYLISFAIGGLLGDVFFHTLPHLSSSHDSHSHDHLHAHEGGHAHSHNPEQMYNNAIIIVGIVAFFLIE